MVMCRSQASRDHRTTASLWFPTAARSTAPGLKGPESTEPGNGERVLVVEPDAAVRAALVRVLEGLGYRALSVADGEAALELLDRPLDVRAVISDVAMAGV